MIEPKRDKDDMPDGTRVGDKISLDGGDDYFVSKVDPVRLSAFDESKHPRDGEGKFAVKEDGKGGVAVSDDSSGTEKAEPVKMFSGYKGSLRNSGIVFFSEDSEYASGYGDISEVEIDRSKLRILDYSEVKSGHDVDYDHEKALEVISSQGVDVSGITFNESTEGHGLLKQLVDAERLAEFDAVELHEWTYGVGEAESLAILDMGAMLEVGAVTIIDP